MIPSIEDILATLLDGQCTKEQATGWIYAHVDLYAERDAFASQAMQGLVAGHLSHYGHDNGYAYNQIAGDAYHLADAMLKARKAGRVHG